MNISLKKILAFILCVGFASGANYYLDYSQDVSPIVSSYTASSLPDYKGKLVIDLQDNQPKFTQEQLDMDQGEIIFQELDELGRVQSVIGMISYENLPSQNEERESIGMVKPSGWQVARYDDLIEDHYLYNRCHLIAWSLSGENANEKNLITGTHALNHEGMLPYEQEILSYIRKTHKPVLYQVAPIYKGEELVCRGVEMQAYSIEDNGRSICFHVFCFNVQPGIEIDYATGESHREGVQNQREVNQMYVVNIRTKKFHDPSCENAKTISKENRKEIVSTKSLLDQEGYEGAGCCINQ